MKQMLHTDINRLRKVIASDTPMCLGTAFTFACGVRDEVTADGKSFAVNRTHDGFRRASETVVVVTNVRHAAKVRLYDSEDRVWGYALTNAAGRGVSVALAYDGSHVMNVSYTLPDGGVLAVRLTRERARKELVTRRDCLFGGQPVYWYETGYDLLGRPTNATDSVSLAREWLYGRRSELAAAAVGTNLYGYAYDSIGNRLWASANTETNSYAANGLNQYASIFCASAPLRETVPQYDADGNMTHDGAFSYSYDAENRLVAVTSSAETNGAIRVLNFYDHRSRRIRKVVQRLSVGVAPPPSPPAETRKWETTETHTFVWDGMNVVLERVAFADGTAHTFEYFWGNDLSGTEQGAGGVGGLLAVSVDGAFHVPCYDHNGNVVRYVSETGAIVAQHVYDPYGNVVESSGPLADTFTFGFSTKCRDRETGLVAYQRRFYGPGLGRWLSRDPIGEEGGVNLYAFCRNNAVGCCDSDGRIVITWPIINPSVPHSWSNLGNDNSPLREEAWFEGNYPGLIAEARRRFTQEIENGIDCSKDTVDGKSTRMNIDPGVAGDWPWSGCIGGNDTEFGDAGQSAWEAVAVLGKFSIDYVTPVNIHYSCEQGRRVYRWTTTMYVEDMVGLQGDEGWFGRYFGWAARSRRVKRAQWTLSGSGVCK